MLRVAETLPLDVADDVAVEPADVLAVNAVPGVWVRCAELFIVNAGHSAELEIRACASAWVMRATAAAMS